MNEKCDEHKMLCQEVTDLKSKNPVSSTQMWGVVVMFVMVSMGIIGWLWHGQLAVKDKLETSQMETRNKLEAYQITLTGISPDGKEGILIRMDKKLDMAIGKLTDHIGPWSSPNAKQNGANK